MIEKLKETVLDYYVSNDLDIPNSVTAYISNYPPGISRQVLKSKYNLTCSELLELINKDYKKSNAQQSLKDACARLNYTLVSDTNKYNSKDRIDVKCNICNYTNNTTLDSLRGSQKGCVKCTSGNLSWSKRQYELEELLLDKFQATLESEIPNNQTGFISLKHIDCGSIYKAQLVGIVSPNTKLRGTCPNCRNTDRRVVFEKLTFGSQFELDCYLVLKHKNPEIHVPYSKYLNTDRRWVCDFKVGDTWIEVSNFKTDYKGYFANLADKQALVESSNYNFFFFDSVKDLKNFSELL